jgi:Mlc titration factor MtfA (ptsG expression regulator)
MRWWATLKRWREARALRQHAIPDVLWAQVLAVYPFIAARDSQTLAELRRLCSLFLSRKEFHGAQGLVVTDAMAVAIAAQACLPILRLGLDAYDGFIGIVVHPDEVVARREVTDDDGVVHHYDEWLTGEAMDGGPVMLAWADVESAGLTADIGYNVVIHEFAHVLDMGDGVADGVPPLSDVAAGAAWVTTLDAAYQAFCNEVDAGLDTLLDPYGAEAPEEFFAVAAEGFFVMPQAMREAHPALYALLAGYFRQNPASAT